MPVSQAAPRPRVLLGITGSIACYKSVLLARRLLQAGASVRVVMTEAAQRFVGKSTFSGITGQEVEDDLFAAPAERHVTLAAEHDCLIVAPASADFIARAAQGRATDLLGALWLCFGGPRFVVPAMHPNMWAHPATQRNVSLLLTDGARLLGPVYGAVASGDQGYGRMLEPDQIVSGVFSQLQVTRDLVGKRLVVSAGPTVEDLDPVRFISNRSSGKMGFAIAAAAAARGATVDLVAGPVALETPPGVQRHNVRSAQDLLQTLRALLKSPCSAVFMAAAVGDYKLVAPQLTKIKRAGPLQLTLTENPDVIATLSAELLSEGCEKEPVRPTLVAFALETGTDAEIIAAAQSKRRAKGVDYVIANAAADGLEGDDNRVTLLGPEGAESWPMLTKRQVAERLLSAIFTQPPATTPVGAKEGPL